MKNRIYLLLLIYISLVSCESKKQPFDDNFIIEYWENGNIAEAYEYDSNRNVHGKYYDFFENGNIKRFGFQHHGKHYGTYFDYDEFDSGRVVRKFDVIILDNNEFVTNNSFYFDSNGDTIFEKSSPFFVFKEIRSDSSDTNPVGIRIEFRNQRYKYSTCYTGKFDSLYNMIDTMGIASFSSTGEVFVGLQDVETGKDTLGVMVYSHDTIDYETSNFGVYYDQYPFEVK